ncbi:MAG: hypothetical protein LBK27_00270 [Treponema sp.]|jgi:uncharacterized integral membrane protein|nr:hypothetical protein [Treponema sp.]
MPWRLIGFIILFGIFLVFIGFNLENRCDISFVFHVFPQVPVFLTAFFSFVVGMLCTLPFAVAIRKKRKNKAEKGSGPELPPPKPVKKRGKRQEIPELNPVSPADAAPYED